MEQLKLSTLLISALLIFTIGCAGDDDDDDNDDNMISFPAVKDPATAEAVEVDRFGVNAGTLFVRTADNGLPAANAAIDFDQGPFITRSFTPDGTTVRYYNFDVMSTTAAPIYVLFKEGADTPVDGQMNIINVIPGDGGYNDFWNVVKVTVPDYYKANSITDAAEIFARDLPMETTTKIVNCPVVPDGSTATLRFGNEPKGLISGWYKGKVVKYFTFEEAELSLSNGAVPLSPIYVTFNINPDAADPDSGPPSGFVLEDGTDQTHNVVQTIPTDADYSPLWTVNVYDNADFANVTDLASAQAANILATGVATVNCPIVDIGN